MKKLPIIGITLGDPKGIGPEVIQKAISSQAVQRLCRPVLFGEEKYFNYKNSRSLTPKQCGDLSGFYIEQAAQAAQKGMIDAMVTGPISKEHLKLAGIPYPGHTEFLAALSHTREVRMMMAGPKLKVVLASIHEPFRDIVSCLTTPSLLRTIEITHHSLKDWFGIKQPRIGIAALNPHAGESGIFGDEERKIISPAIQKALRKKIRAFGPYPADTIYYRAVRGEFDAVVAMYHDQGLIPLKLLHFEEGVNITLGLPFIRTSVDHGTAFDIAGKGVADSRSMVAAIQTAVELAKKWKR